MASPVFFKLVVPRLLAALVLTGAGLAWTHPAKARAAWGLARKCACGLSCLLPTREEMGVTSVGAGLPWRALDPLGLVPQQLLPGAQGD